MIMIRKQIILCFIPLLLCVSAARKEKKTTLEDVERGYITTKSELSPPPLPKIPAKSPTQFGFVPVKTTANYAQKQPKITYAQPQYTSENQGDSTYPTQIQYTIGTQYVSGTRYTSPVYTGPSKEAAQKTPSHTQAYYVPQEQSQDLKYDSVAYVADNTIDQGAGQQNYDSQQFYYLQQYQEPSTSIQAVVDPKGGLQYIMYIPTYVPNQLTEQTQNQENVVYTNNQQQTYQSPQPEYNTYSENPKTFETGKSMYNLKANEAPFIRREPKSLLDSYIPSSLQLQYYKQSRLNAIRDNQKYEHYSPIGAESTYRYNIRPTPFRQ
ncbi:uncharacterized protein LOC130440654 [Diorhabda sublineata]|uniref:uncharacterized protein LOC130440654 n=1 Tax=Diorhabda sublineata TaxID=1163346 RepID=UPI0024E18769|nr:uncharacterized protein LOC130440654 [Diorhabda sublineata]